MLLINPHTKAHLHWLACECATTGRIFTRMMMFGIACFLSSKDINIYTNDHQEHVNPCQSTCRRALEVLLLDLCYMNSVRQKVKISAKS